MHDTHTHITDDSYFTQWEREGADVFNKQEETPIGPVNVKHKEE